MKSAFKKKFLLCLLMLLFSTTVAVSQNSNTNIKETTPTSRFLDKGNGTVADLKTSLMWKKAHESDQYTWDQALQSAQEVNGGGGFAGYTDWHVPSAEELKSLVEEKGYDPAINLTVFPGPPSGYFWSSSSDASYDNGHNARVVYLPYGSSALDVKYSKHYVRLVRRF